ncbi:hypothetical protein BKA56DRAFT_257879 [Ilyonectria sp. MPI-CAGE-AT-0026]|nr:hypothetical protein BKA56DRAFT_257879 [Ilyonectria sp. MPI-CAGE-AT-0026]
MRGTRPPSSSATIHSRKRLAGVLLALLLHTAQGLTGLHFLQHYAKGVDIVRAREPGPLGAVAVLGEALSVWVAVQVNAGVGQVSQSRVSTPDDV